MENKEMKKPVELEDDALDAVSGGTSNVNNLESDIIKEETMIIIPIT